jgi:hypothetical protein
MMKPKKPLIVPAVLAVVVLATGCGRHDCPTTKYCVPSHDAGVVDATSCPTDLDPSLPCPPGCEEAMCF